MNPLALFRLVAVAEGCSWVGLLVGMYLKRVTETTELGVQVFGPIHGALFVAYGIVTLVVSGDQKWGPRRTALALVSAVPPLMTVWFDWYAERRGWIADQWRERAGA
ncbi:MAG TPA: DUF3817 domain-containing protein [Nocardioides sp.]|uniref:DUF3817 domain-containing protein n=1 Tax=Nocardioides sp. TaxID=35761 RepID=UPI002ED97A86